MLSTRAFRQPLESLAATFRMQLRSSGLPALPVVDQVGTVIGLITTDNITDLLLVRRHLSAPT